MRRDDIQPDASCIYRWQRLRQNLGHWSALAQVAYFNFGMFESRQLHS